MLQKQGNLAHSRMDEPKTRNSYLQGHILRLSEMESALIPLGKYTRSIRPLESAWQGLQSNIGPQFRLCAVGQAEHRLS